MRESTEWGNILLNGIGFAHGIISSILRDGSSTNAVNLFVELSSGVVTELTTTSNSPFYRRWMPSSDTGDLTETSMRASLKTSNSESLDHTLSSLTSCNSNGVNALRLLEDFGNLDLLFKLSVSEVDLGSNISSVQLDFHDVRFDLSKVKLLQLSSADNANGSAIFLHAVEIPLDGFWITFRNSEAFNVLLECVLAGL